MKLLGVIALLILCCSSSLAFFPSSFNKAKLDFYSEVCEYSYTDYTTFWCRYFSYCSVNYKITCDLSKVIACNNLSPKNYSCMPDIERSCYRACVLDRGLPYSRLVTHMFSPSSCYCLKDDYEVLAE